jgi:hypothetical protein
MNRGSPFIFCLINLIVISTVIFTFLISSAHASDKYYDDGTTSDLVSTIFSNNVGADSQQNGYGCVGCHASTGTVCNADGVTQTAFLNYSGLAACIDRAIIKVGVGPYGGGNRMPQGCTSGVSCVTGPHQGLLSTWRGLGMPLAPPTVSTSTPISVTKTGATLRGTFNPNTSIGGTYGFNWGLTTGYGTTTSLEIITGTIGASRTTSITGLTCGTTYNYRGVAGNGGESVNGSNQSFSTSACTAPVITEGASESIVTSEDTTASLTLNATDNDPGTLNWTVVSPAGNNGSAIFTGDGTGTSEPFSYSPNLNHTGSDSFLVRVTNATSGLFDEITVSVTVNAVNDAPTATNLSSAEAFNEDASGFSLTDIVVSDVDTGANITAIFTLSDPSAGSLSVATSNAVTSAFNSGTGVWSAVGALADVNVLLAGVSFTPNLNYDQNFMIGTSISDGVAAALTGSKPVTVTPVPDGPVITGNDTLGMAEDTVGNLALAVTDGDPGTLNWTIQTAGADGSASVSGSDGSQTVAYTPDANFTGTDNFTVRVTNATSSLFGDHDVTVTVTAVTDPPFITENPGPITRTIDEDSSPGVFALTLNATDADDITGAVIQWNISIDAMGGTADVSGNGLSKAISYTPNADFNGTDSFTVRVFDGALEDTILVSVTVNPIPDGPVITGDTTLGIAEDSVGNVLLNTSDGDDGVLNWAILSAASNGLASVSGIGASQTISYTPILNYTGGDSFTVRVTNGTSGLFDDHEIEVTVTEVTDTPVITEGDGSLTQTIDEDSSPIAFALTLNATDGDDVTGAVIAWSISSAASNGVANVSGNGLSQAVSYTPNLDFTGSDSFRVQVFDGATSDSITVDVTIMPVNDPPTITALGTQSGTEGSLVTFAADVVDVDNINDGVEISWTFVSGEQSGMSLSNTGAFSWTPLLGPPAVFDQSYPITIRATDSTSFDDESFVIDINPPDTDGDLVADYDDLCLTASDATNADNDGDGTAGSDGGINDGGNVCDLDDDNDGMPDTFETENELNPFDAADADLDADGDGINTLAEFLAGSNPNFANITIDSTGYLTPFTLIPPAPTVVAAAATGVISSDSGPYRPGHFDITWTASNSSNANLGTSIQSFDVRPIVSFAPDQVTEEGSVVNVVATLNGSAAIYPVTVNYIVTGTADASDHNAVAGSFVMVTPEQMVSLPFNVLLDGLNEGTETVVFTMTSAINAVVGSDMTHLVSIVEDNVAPVVNLQLRQGGKDVSTAYESGGTVTVNAVVTDVNSAQTHSYDWSITDNSLSPPTDSTSQSWAFTPVAGNYLIDLNSTDNGSPVLSNRTSRVLSILTIAPVLDTRNSDGEGADDITEGLGDSDADGIPDYLDAQSAGITDQYLIPNQTVDITSRFLVQTEPGIKIVTGDTARASNNSGVIVTDANIGNFGSVSGGAPLNAIDDFEHVGGVYDFELSGLVSGQSANIVIPLQSAIPINAIFRKFKSDTGWSNFVVDNNNRLASAPGVLGACPEPDSSQYIDGLVAFSNCLQLTIQDGGPNDADGVANGVIKDPGSLSINLQSPVTPTVQGSGRIDIVMLLGLILLIWCRVYAYSRVNRR